MLGERSRPYAVATVVAVVLSLAMILLKGPAMQLVREWVAEGGELSLGQRIFAAGAVFVASYWWLLPTWIGGVCVVIAVLYDGWTDWRRSRRPSH